MDRVYDKAEVKNLPDSEAEVSVSVPYEKLLVYRTKALEHLKKETALPGFRKGKVPEKIILERAGEMSILQEAAEILVKDLYPSVLADKKLDAIGAPNISINKLAPGNPLELSIKIALLPVFDLPDYKTLAEQAMDKKEIAMVTDEEVEKVIKEIRNLRKTKKENGEEELLELSDDFVKTVGEFKDVPDFKNKIKENLLKEKEFRLKEKTRLEIMAKISEKSEIPVPKVLLEGELDRMLGQFSHDIKRAGTTVADYLKKINKTEEILRKEWEKDAMSRVKFELILDKIANIEKIKASEEEVEKETKHLVEHHSGAVPERVRSYVEHQLRNESVFKFLEGQK